MSGAGMLERCPEIICVFFCRHLLFCEKSIIFISSSNFLLLQIDFNVPEPIAVAPAAEIRFQHVDPVGSVSRWKWS